MSSTFPQFNICSENVFVCAFIAVTVTQKNYLIYYLQNKEMNIIYLKRVWRYQRGNQNPYIEEEQTKQWQKEKLQTTIYKTPHKA